MVIFHSYVSLPEGIYRKIGDGGSYCFTSMRVCILGAVCENMFGLLLEGVSF